MSKRILLIPAIWAFAFLIALLLDFPVARAVHNSGVGQHIEGTWWAQVIKEPGQFRFTLAVVFLLVIFKQLRWKQAVYVLLASILSGLHVFLKWGVGRTRPYKLPGLIQPRPFELHPFRDGVHGFFHQTNLSFPSGHVCPASALAACMFVVWPRGAWIFVPLAILVGSERVAENAHYCSDVVAAAAVGVMCSKVAHEILKSWMTSRSDLGPSIADWRDSDYRLPPGPP